MRAHRFTIYDALESSGYFEANPANSYSRDPTTGTSKYTGPVEYPKMLYHPEGEERVTVAAELINTPMGPKAVGEQKELIHLIVGNSADEVKAAEEGWWDHPAKAVQRRVELLIENDPSMTEKQKSKLLSTIPPISIASSSESKIRELEKKIAELTASQVEEAKPVSPAAVNSLGARFSNPLTPTPEATPASAL